MFCVSLKHSGHVRNYSIRHAAELGWEVKLEQDEALTRFDHYDDWHRVERARAAFEVEVARLTESGWRIQSTNR